MEWVKMYTFHIRNMESIVFKKSKMYTFFQKKPIFENDKNLEMNMIFVKKITTSR